MIPEPEPEPPKKKGKKGKGKGKGKGKKGKKGAPEEPVQVYRYVHADGVEFRDLTESLSVRVNRLRIAQADCPRPGMIGVNNALVIQVDETLEHWQSELDERCVHYNFASGC